MKYDYQYRQLKALKELQPGDIVRSKANQSAYIVTGNYGTHVTAVRSQDVSNPMEWEVWRLNPTTEQDK